MNPTVDLATLEARHKALEKEIKTEMNRPLPDQAHITELKRKKLKFKEEIASRMGMREVA